MRLKPNNPVLSERRTIHIKSRKPITDKQVIKSVANNDKLGNGSNIITKGKWKGWPMFSITLEERATCPSYCHHWDDCFGNNMAFAHRFIAGPELEDKIRTEVRILSLLYKNFVIRLHILGDFYSRQYVMMWHKLLADYPGLHVFGYTAHWNTPGITDEIMAIRTRFASRFWVRFSTNNKLHTPAIIATREDYTEPAITCPEQQGKVDSCLGCGLCWAIEKPIKFLSH